MLSTKVRVCSGALNCLVTLLKNKPMRTCLFCCLVILGWGYQACKPPQASDTPDAAVLLDSIAQMHIQLDSLQKGEIANGDVNYWTDNSQTLHALKKQGIADPKTFVANNLSERTDLIPMKPILGGTMLFNRIMLVGDHWAIAEFEDGHVGGEMLLAYTVDANQKITWKAVQAHQVD
jgi:hypothetical protein